MIERPNLLKKKVSCFPKEYFLIVLFVLFSTLNIFAEDNIQQLESKLISLPDDTVKANTLIKLGKHYCSVDNEKALFFLQEAFTISTAENYQEGIGLSLLWQGRVYYYKDEYNIAIKYLDKAKRVLETLNNSDALALDYFSKGEIFKNRGDFIGAFSMYNEANRIAEFTQNLKLQSVCHTSMGGVILERNEPEKALVYFREALKQIESISDSACEASVLSQMGIAFEKLNDLDSALIYHNKSLKIRTKLKMDRGIASSKCDIGDLLIKMGDYKQAEESLQTALENYRKLDEKTGICITSFHLATARNYQGKTGAFNLAESTLSMARRINNPSLISHGYKTLSDISFHNKDYKRSYEYLLKHKTLQDSLFTADKERLLTEFEAKFQSARKDNEIRLLKGKSENQRKNNVLLTILIIVLVGIIVLLFFMFRLKSTAFNRQQKLIDQENIIHTQENEIIEKEKLILQKQLESKNRELASKALEMLRYNDTISIIIEKLGSFKSTIDKSPEESKNINKIIYELENQTKQNIWNEFDKIFKNIHSGFYDKLLEICPDLTATEIKTAALLKLNLTTKEIASITFKSEGGIKTTRYRLRKRLNLSSDEKLVPFLMKI